MSQEFVRAWTGRNTYRIAIGRLTLIFSYDTCIAASGPDGGFRDSTNYSRTTNKHHKLHGTDHWTALDREDFEKFVKSNFAVAGMECMTDVLKTKPGERLEVPC